VTFVSEHTPMVACDGCGGVAAAHIAVEKGWRSFFYAGRAAAHQCPACVEGKNNLEPRSDVYKVPGEAASAVVYAEGNGRGSGEAKEDRWTSTRS
jgi:hypothetical protein